MNSKYLILLLAFALGSYSSCEGYFGGVTPIEGTSVPALERFTLSAVFTNRDSNLYLRTDRSTDILEGYTNDFDNPASINYPVFDENNLSIHLLNDSQDTISSFSYLPPDERSGGVFDDTTDIRTLVNNYISKADAPNLFVPGNTYTLSVEHPSMGSFLIRQRMPQPIIDADFTVYDGTVTNGFGVAARRIKATWLDRSDQNDFYQIRVFRINVEDGTIYQSNLTDQDPRTPSTPAFSKTLVLSDEGQNGQVLDLNFTASLVFDNLEFHSFEITAITEEWYKLVSSYREYQRLEEDINNGYVEPFPVYTNVPNGFGYFLLGNRTLLYE